jgi:hypothetical protein
MAGIFIEIRRVSGHLLFNANISYISLVKRRISLYDFKLAKSQDPRERL